LFSKKCLQVALTLKLMYTLRIRNKTFKTKRFWSSLFRSQAPRLESSTVVWVYTGLEVGL